MTETMASSIAMVEIAEYALKTGKVKQVLLLEHVPRYDTDAKDKDKKELAILANKEFHKARNVSEYSHSIFVGRHTGLECEGSTRVSRFTSDHSNRLHGLHIRMGKYDGIHMYSQVGAEALTKSILNIFRKAGLVKNKKSSPSSQVVQHRQSSSSSQGHNQPWAPSQPSVGPSQEEVHQWNTNQPVSRFSQEAGHRWVTNQQVSSSNQVAGQNWYSSQSTSPSSQGEEQLWSTQPSRNGWNRNSAISSLEPPSWQIPTNNMFQGFY